jgi:hypothetical protein
MGKDRQQAEGRSGMLGSSCASVALAAALLLAGAGVAKLRAPHPAAAMLRRALPGPLRTFARPAVVRLAGLGELAVALAAVLTGGRVALALLAAAYAAFLVLSIRLATAPTATSCGCFGQADSPVGAGHVVLNLVALGSALVGAVRPPGAWLGRFDGAALTGVVAVAQAGLLAVLGYLAITALPALAADRRRAAR